MKRIGTTRPAAACKRLSMAVIFSALGACDTGGSDESGNLLSGVFMKGAVEGVRYQTSSQSGLTDSGGGFIYREGETVTFSLGGITLGSALAAERIDLFDLYRLEPPASEVTLRAELANTEVISDFDRVANIAMLLVTLDNDRRLDNGIDASGWDQQLADTGLNFDKNLYTFPSERGPDTLTALKTIFAIDYSVPVAVPLPYLYRTQGIQVPAHLPVLRRSDFGNDGSVDSILAQDYDGQGRLTGDRYDNDADGDFEIVSESEYDAAHRLTHSESRSDSDGDGSPETVSRTSREYDTGGNPASNTRERDEGADDIVDTISAYSYRYDGGGNLLESSYQWDDGADGEIEVRRSIRRSYDDTGNLLSETWEDDDNGDGVANRRAVRSNSYDGEGRLLDWTDEVDGDDVADGIVDYRYSLTRTYDSADRVASERAETDMDADGTVENRTANRYEYDDSGRMLSRISEIDFGADGTVDSRTTYSYEYSGGRLVRSTVDAENLSVSSLWEPRDSVTEYNYHDNGQLQQRVRTSTAEDGSLLSRTTDSYTYGPDGNLLSERSEREGEDNGHTASNFEMTYEYETVEDGLLFLLDYYRVPVLSPGIGVIAVFGGISIDDYSGFSSSSRTNPTTTAEAGP
ncbi:MULTISPECIES: hypothetical protein [unclassified Microbulbifer]|uniref:hypothetical protein n=1 Tax=unclassified Microbulbifer TaxID=2619833 RepID=UPI0027E4C8CD|nr:MULTISPECIES: hypothetical protein [unclassified Microbulbifer]